MKRLILILFCLVTGGTIILSTYFVSMHRQINKAWHNTDIQLEAYQQIFLDKINKFKHLPFSVSKDRTILRLFENRTDQLTANILIKAIQVRSGASVVYIMDKQGNTIASSNYDEPDSFVGNNYNFRPYFQRAMEGREGSMYAIGATSGIPGYYLSHPIMLNNTIVGVAVVKFQLSELQNAWKSSNNIVMAKDPNGVIVLSSRADWINKTLEPLPEDLLKTARKGRLYKGAPLAQLDTATGTSLGAKWIEIDQTQYLLREQRIPGKPWELIVLVPWSDMVDDSIRKTLIASLTCLTAMAGVLLILAFRLKQRMERRIERARRTRLIDTEREESLRQLADSIAHQIRNPLLGIGGNANLLKRKLPEDEGMVEHLGTIMDCCQDLENLVASVRDYIDIIPTQTTPFDLETLIKSVRSAAMDLVNPPGKAVDWHISIEPVVLPMDKALISKCIHEILTNALEARKGDTISIEIIGKWKTDKECAGRFETPSERCYTLTFCDSGSGIDKEIFNHVMEPFFSTKPHGTGLGLAKAKRVVQIFHGEFSIISPVPGHTEWSTMVQLTLPLLDDAELE
ncbi:cache domain-containing protein [uncultured Pseudodesulfovibrio sp.]|uniref:cache domain-containing protein n=1 Tax=uncultured Pseudodesulfovibrio sp. TaxID=2035858 RepID=UPI0029C6E921|nr:cache domain-containing protein [uncultured Pseudodesulfovibrio sp.]